MKYIKLFEEFNSIIEYRYNRFLKELEIYMQFFKEEWKFTGEVGRIPKIDEYIETYHATNNPNIGIILSQDYRRILISVGADNRALVHYWENNLNETGENSKRTLYTFNMLTDWGMMKTRINNGKPSILDVMKESKERGFNPILRVCQSKQKAISEGDPKTNVLDNILNSDILGIIENKSKFVPQEIEKYYYLIPYFIFFSNEDVIKRWWSDAKNDKSVYKIADVIKKDPQIYDKFKSIIPDDISDAAEMHGMGFSD